MKSRTGVPADRRFHYDVQGAGHYGIFSGRRWRDMAYPQVRDFIRRYNPVTVTPEPAARVAAPADAQPAMAAPMQATAQAAVPAPKRAPRKAAPAAAVTAAVVAPAPKAASKTARKPAAKPAAVPAASPTATPARRRSAKPRQG